MTNTIKWPIPEKPKDFVVKISICKNEKAFKFSTSDYSGSNSLIKQTRLRCTSGSNRQIIFEEHEITDFGAEYRFPINPDLHVWFISEYSERITYGEDQFRQSFYPAILVFIGSDDPRDARGQLVLNFAKNTSTFQIEGDKLIIRSEKPVIKCCS